MNCLKSRITAKMNKYCLSSLLNLVWTTTTATAVATPSATAAAAATATTKKIKKQFQIIIAGDNKYTWRPAD